MRRPPFPFEMMRVRAEEERDSRQRAYLRRRETWRAQQRAVGRQETVMADLFAQISSQRAAAPRGPWEQSHRHYLNRQQERLGELNRRERELAAEAETCRQELFQAALRLRVWESLRERFWNDWDAQQRRREEAELEDWTRSRLKPVRSRAVI